MSDMSELERALYGDVENDAELEAELLALQDDSDDEVSPPPPVTKKASKPLPQPRKANEPRIQSRPAPGVPDRSPGKTNFGEIDRLGR